MNRKGKSKRTPAVELALAALLLLCAARAGATPTDYTINFNLMYTSPGIDGPSGSFVYDPDVGFSNFLVSWDGYNFDLTAAANAPFVGSAPGPCDPTGLANAASSFYILSNPGACSSLPGYTTFWNAYVYTGPPQTPGFSFYADSPPGHPDFIAIGVNDGGGNTSLVSGGATWTLTAQTAGVPEPSTAVMISMGVALILGTKALRRRRRASSNS
jgi:hypothetical protein